MSSLLHGLLGYVKIRAWRSTAGAQAKDRGSGHSSFIFPAHGRYTRFNIPVLPQWPSLASILSATEMSGCPPCSLLNELSVPLWHGSSSLLLLTTRTQQKLDNGQNWSPFHGSAPSTRRNVLDLKRPCNPGFLISNVNGFLHWTHPPFQCHRWVTDNSSVIFRFGAGETVPFKKLSGWENISQYMIKFK